MIESSICVPSVLGSVAILTPRPKNPLGPSPTQLEKISNKIINN